MKKITLFILTGIILSACSSIKVISDYDKTVDFTKYKSLKYYGWAEDSDKILSPFDKERIENSVANEFEKRGIKIVNGDADIIVSLFVVAEQKTQKTAHTTSTGGMYGGYGGYYDYGPGYGWGGGHSTTTYSEHEYTVGTLAISVYDAQQKQLIWESIGEGTVDDNPKNAEEDISKSVAKIMATYPIQATKE